MTTGGRCSSCLCLLFLAATTSVSRAFVVPFGRSLAMVSWSTRTIAPTIMTPPLYSASGSSGTSSVSGEEKDDEWFQQKPGESDMDFIKRLTNQAPPAPSSSETKAKATKTKPAGTYQRAEDWDAQRKADGIEWEEKVKFEGQRFGDQVKQNEILKRNLFR